jgi:hypothetical protein
MFYLVKKIWNEKVLLIIMILMTILQCPSKLQIQDLTIESIPLGQIQEL